MTDPSLALRLAEAEWAYVANPAYVSRTRFGRFVNHPWFRAMREAHQLFDCRCSAKDLDALVADVERLRDEARLAQRTISTVDDATAGVLADELPSHGWFEQPSTRVMVYRGPSLRRGNAKVDIVELSDATIGEWEALLASEHPAHLPAEYHREYVAFARAQDRRVGRRVYLAYLDGTAVGTVGCYVVDGIARCRGLLTHRAVRNRGIGATLIHYVQNQPMVRMADALTLTVVDGGPRPLYESLGFTTVASLRRFFR